jgi:hypothetical protein
MVLNVERVSNDNKTRRKRGKTQTQNRWHSWPCPVRLFGGLFFTVLRATFYITLATYNLAKWGEGLNNPTYIRKPLVILTYLSNFAAP